MRKGNADKTQMEMTDPMVLHLYKLHQKEYAGTCCYKMLIFDNSVAICDLCERNFLI